MLTVANASYEDESSELLLDRIGWLTDEIEKFLAVVDNNLLMRIVSLQEGGAIAGTDDDQTTLDEACNFMRRVVSRELINKELFERSQAL